MICLYASRNILDIDYMRFDRFGQNEKALILHDVVEESNIIVDPSTINIELNGIHGTITAKLPAKFFIGATDVMTGKVLGVAIIKDAKGTSSDVSAER